jgi:hypothetical protein
MNETFSAAMVNLLNISVTIQQLHTSQESAVVIDYDTPGRSRVRIPVGTRMFSLLRDVQRGSYSVDTRLLFQQ